jgi:NADH:ubiquinone oxidoreductase subunit 4 (subunit M)
MQRVFLGKLNPKYAGYSDMTFREVFCQAPFLFLCVALGVFPMFLTDWMQASIAQWVATMGG